MNHSLTRLIAGCMTGTSLDAIDAALVEINGTGLDMRARFIGMVSLDLGDLRQPLKAITSGKPHPPVTYARMGRTLGELHKQAVTQLCAQHMPTHGGLDLVVAHGQTIWHAPDEALSWQLMDPWPVVRHLRVPVLYDLRQADLIAGGQGAPITPLADWVLYRDLLQLRLIVNLGGICNVTDLPADCQPADITGGDIGPCNLLIDGLVQRLYPKLTYDTDGKIAAQGHSHPEFTTWVKDSPFFRKTGKHSTGREDFNDAWLDALLIRAKNHSPKSWSSEDVIASAVDAVAHIITDHCKKLPDNRHMILAGGGARNPVLVDRIKAKLDPGDRISISDELGIPVAAREAAAFAVLGALSQDNVPITLPQITGAPNPGKAGVWAYP